MMGLTFSCHADAQQQFGDHASSMAIRINPNMEQPRRVVVVAAAILMWSTTTSFTSSSCVMFLSSERPLPFGRWLGFPSGDAVSMIFLSTKETGQQHTPIRFVVSQVFTLRSQMTPCHTAFGPPHTTHERTQKRLDKLFFPPTHEMARKERVAVWTSVWLLLWERKSGRTEMNSKWFWWWWRKNDTHEIKKKRERKCSSSKR